MVRRLVRASWFCNHSFFDSWCCRCLEITGFGFDGGGGLEGEGAGEGSFAKQGGRRA